MDAKVDDFFNEINEIAPSKPPETKSNVESVWKQCQDELTGYSYYWNCKTDEVTWEAPAEFRQQKKDKSSVKNTKKPFGMYVPPRTEFFTDKKISKDTIKIYSIGENSNNKPPPKLQQKKTPKSHFKGASDSEDEKIELISSYGGESETDEDDQPNEKKPKMVIDKESNDSNLSEEDDDTDILTKIQKKAKELKELGGELPSGVKEVVENRKVVATVIEKEAEISGFSLVAGYSDSEEEDNEIKAAFQPQLEPPVSHSTLFPIPQTIDMNDFIQPKFEAEKQVDNECNFDNKAFKRKRRIGVALVNTAKKTEKAEIVEEKKGLGFEKDTDVIKSENVYPGFKKGGVLFVKADVLNPTDSSESEEKVEKVGEIETNKEVDKMYATLKEKLVFLNGGRPEVSPVQSMVIQAETLFVAMNEGGLDRSYLQKWLTETCAELIKLEKDATPEGWLLQWDRSHKRYYYVNLATGVGQWEYPQPDVNTNDDAMDISTTPPPTEQIIRMSPPLPPPIRSPSPPPPPIISADERIVTTILPDVPLPPEPDSATKDIVEPLPPGVDLPEMICSAKSQENTVLPSDPLNSALNSFYSEVAAIDASSSTTPPPQNEQIPLENFAAENALDTTKKKKKAKVKLAPGLSMKKKGVSQLVEKWKSVQQHYND